MTRDYAKHSLSRKKPQKKGSYFILWLLVLALFITLTLGLVYFGKNTQHSQHLTKTTKKIVTKPKQKKPTEVVTKEIPIPKFDFYTILPQKRNSESIAEYELEIATVKDYGAADQLKAELALLGFTVSITPTYTQDIQKFQVSVGPYDNKDGATADLERLKQNKIRGILKKIR